MLYCQEANLYVLNYKTQEKKGNIPVISAIPWPRFGYTGTVRMLVWKISCVQCMGSASIGIVDHVTWHSCRLFPGSQSSIVNFDVTPYTPQWYCSNLATFVDLKHFLFRLGLRVWQWRKAEQFYFMGMVRLGFNKCIKVLLFNTLVYDTDSKLTFWN